MLANADCTLYLWSENGYTRHEIKNVYWNESSALNLQKFGVWNANSITVYFYDNKILPKTLQKDLIVKGICDFEFDNGSPEKISESRQKLLKMYNVKTIVGIDDKWFGGLPHYEITAK